MIIKAERIRIMNGKRHAFLKVFMVLLIFSAPVIINSSLCIAQHVVIDHTCTDLSSIPATSINAAKAGIKWHYAHTSHGSQLTTGLERIESGDSTYDAAIGYSSLPVEAGALCIYDGQEYDTYITPDLYWESQSGRQDTQNVLNNNPTINVSMWSWCTQLDYYDQGQVQTYLDAMAAFEAANPGVTFVYMTGNAQATGWDGYNRYLRNNQIRNWVKDNPSQNRVLFDFADLDSWWYNSQTGQWEQATYEYWDGSQNVSVPVEHSRFNGDEAGHTTYESCEQKGRAVWWMLAVLAGWNPSAHNYSGWWYTPDENGTGISIEVQGDVLFLAWYTYDQTTGLPIWHTSGGQMTGSDQYSGNLLKWTGWPLGSEYSAPQSTPVGTVQLSFSSTDQADLQWTLGENQGQKIINRFMDDISPGSRDSRDILGWWYDPSFDGMGIFMEAQGNSIFLAWYHYRSDGSSRWWSCGGNFALGATTYSGTLQEWSDGQCIGCSYQEPACSDKETITITFSSDGSATFTWAGSVFDLQRFRFDHL